MPILGIDFLYHETHRFNYKKKLTYLPSNLFYNQISFFNFAKITQIVQLYLYSKYYKNTI